MEEGDEAFLITGRAFDHFKRAADKVNRGGIPTDRTGERRRRFATPSGKASPAILVGLSYASGHDGGPAGACTYIYNAVSFPDSAQTWTNVDLHLNAKINRPIVSTMPATFGWLVVNDSGTPEIVLHNESINFGTC